MLFKLKRISLRKMIVVPIILLILVSVFLVGYFSLENGRNSVSSASLKFREEIAFRVQARTSSFLEAPQIICNLTSRLAAGGLLNLKNPHEMQLVFLELIHAFPQISSIYFGNMDGGLINAGRETSGEFYTIETENYSAGSFYKHRVDSLGNRVELLAEIPNFDARSRSWFTMALLANGSPARTDPFQVFTGDNVSISTSVVVFDDSGDIAGVVSCDVFLSYMGNFLETINIGEEGVIFITDPESNILTSSINEDSSHGSSLFPAREHENLVVSETALHIDSLYGGFSGIDSTLEFALEEPGLNSFVQVVPFQDSIGKTYFIVTVIQDSDFLNFLEKNRRITLLLLAVSLLVALLTGMFVAKLISKPLQDLRVTVRQLLKGEEKDFASHWMEEVNELSADFSRLTHRLKSTMNDLRQSEESMDLALRGIGAATWDWNLVTGRIIVNDRWAKIIGYSLSEISPVTEEFWKDLIHPEDIDETYLQLQEHFDGVTESYEATFRLKHTDGNWIWVVDKGTILERDESGNPLRMTGIHLDISPRKHAEIEQKRLQIQVDKAQKLKSIGQLAGGVAHDLNNLLTPIIGYAEMLLSDLNEDTNPQPYSEILRAGKSAQGLVNRLLAFGRKQVLKLEVIDLNLVVSDYMNLLRRTIREDISITFDLLESPLPIYGDPSQLEQVLTNLAVNAQDAMPGRGNMLIHTSLSASNVLNKKCAVLQVSDDGTGMDEDTINKIYEPFFSTKGDLGTGLGLATVYGIIQQHGGSISVESAPGEGSSFTILLPISDKTIIETKKSHSAEKTSSNQTILVVEDSDEVREISVIALKRFGYTVFNASSGQEALGVIEANRDSIDLMLTDVIMPGISLEKLHMEALKLIPDLKVVYMSGYSGDKIKDRTGSDNRVPFISKPFSLQDLSDKLSSVLGESIPEVK